MDDNDYDWKAAYGWVCAQHQRVVMQLQQLREGSAGLLATIEQINEAFVDLDPYRPPHLPAIWVS